jgi:hypothetical protein
MRSIVASNERDLQWLGAAAAARLGGQGSGSGDIRAGAAKLEADRSVDCQGCKKLPETAHLLFNCAALARARAVFRYVRRWAMGRGPTKRRAGSEAVGLQKSKINDCALTDAIGAPHVETCTRRDVLRTRSSVATHYTAAAPTSVPTAPVRAGRDLAIGR